MIEKEVHLSETGLEMFAQEADKRSYLGMITKEPCGTEMGSFAGKTCCEKMFRKGMVKQYMEG